MLRLFFVPEIGQNSGKIVRSSRAMLFSTKGREANMSRRTEQLNGAIGAYFAACDATRERHELKNGGIEERQIPYTLFGLARAVRLTPEEVLAAFHTDRRSKENAILRDAVLKVAAYTLERTLLGELNYQSALEALRAMGLNQAAEQADGVLEIVLDSAAERYSK